MELNPKESVRLWNAQKSEIDYFKNRILDSFFYNSNPSINFSGEEVGELSQLIEGKSHLFIQNLKSIIINHKEICFDISIDIEKNNDEEALVGKIVKSDFDICCLGLTMSRDNETDMVDSQLKISPLRNFTLFKKCSGMLECGYPTFESLMKFKITYLIKFHGLDVKSLNSLSSYLSANSLLMGYFVKAEAPSGLMRTIFNTRSLPNSTVRGRPRMLYGDELELIVSVMKMDADEIKSHLERKPLLRDGYNPENLCARHDFAFRLILSIEMIGDCSKINSSLPIKDVWAACKANLDLIPIEYRKFCE